MKQKILIISCIFGNKFKKVYPAPVSTDCYFFSNNITLQNEVENKGWKFIYVNLQLSNDSIKSSLQSKYIKFLIFLDDYPEFKKYKQILYFDHKVFIKQNDVDELMEILNENNNYNIIIRKHETYRDNIWSEVEEAKKQERYRKNMDKTIAFINNKIQKDKISPDVQICNTGMILYNNYDEVSPMLHNIYNTCVELEQPECQIIWSIYSQDYADKIILIEFNYIKPLWKEPFTIRNGASELSSVGTTRTNNYLMHLFCIIVIFLCGFYLYTHGFDVTKIIKTFKKKINIVRCSKS